ncbi:MAG: class I SAM-dependent methyltransferase [Geobacteraceae bacterium]|nr:class I SAM-dependent methyltransferase [Geobacteraceae bacterium]
MRTDSKALEADRMQGLSVENYPILHERHRLFPEIFEQRNHKNIIDISAGMGIIAKRIKDNYPCYLSCNEVDETCLKQLEKLQVNLSSFDLDATEALPLEDQSYDAILCLATIEHLVNVDHFITELHRVLKDSGRLYLSVPNYAALYWMIPLVMGKTFHDPLDPKSRYEFYAHIRYFTYHTLVEYMEHFGFTVDTVYLPLPEGSSHFMKIRSRSKAIAFLIRNFFRLFYLASPRWHQEPVVCFAKNYHEKPRKVIL